MRVACIKHTRKQGKFGIEELVQGLSYKIEKRLACKHIFTDCDNTFVSKIISSYNIIAWFPFCGICKQCRPRTRCMISVFTICIQNSLLKINKIEKYLQMTLKTEMDWSNW